MVSSVNTKSQAMYVQHDTEERSCNHRYSGNAIRITYSACVSVVLGTSIQYACTAMPSVACPALSFSHTVSQMALFSRQKKLLNIKCVSFDSTNFV